MNWSLILCLRKVKLQHSVQKISYLDQNTSDSLIQSKIFINELLSKNQFNQFKQLKAVARGLGFKYTWHRGGHFLVKIRDVELSHSFMTAADLQAIAAPYITDKVKVSTNVVAGNITNNATEQTSSDNNVNVNVQPVVTNSTVIT